MLHSRQAFLGRLEIASNSGSGHAFAKHSHDECVIGVNLVGEEQVWLDRRSFRAGAGDITLYNPGQIQGGGVKEGEPWRYVGLYVTAEQLADDLGLARVEFQQACSHQPDLAASLADAVERALGGDALVRERAEERLLLWLGRLVQRTAGPLPDAAAVGVGPMARVQELLAERLQDSPSLDELATELGLCKFHLLRAFQKHTGLSPRQWAMQLRTRRARGLLRAGWSATDAAHALGFADQSHLNRHFRAAYGITPGEMKRLFNA